ncbi:MAG TPA: DUF2863 family protein [Sulfuriferula sp.]|nr:DUF2863 family protein [Sulfuriferula sp.]
MKRPRLPRTPRLSRDATQLLRLAIALSVSASRMEDRLWARQLDAQIDSVLDKGQEDTLESALDQLWTANPPAYDALAQAIESRSSGLVGADGQEVLLIAVPVQAWSRYSIAAGAIVPARMMELRAQLHGHVLAAGARLALADVLFSPDQLPRGFAATRTFARSLADAAAHQQDMHVDPASLAQVIPFVADVRYVVGAVMVAPGTAVFRWQEAQHSREQVLRDWQAHGGAVLQTMLPGCAIEVLLPNAYFSAWRESDLAGRGWGLRAAMDYLHAMLALPAASLRAVVAPFYDHVLEEYRIGFTEMGSNDVLHGVVWPLIGNEDENTEVTSEIETIVRAAGIGEVLLLNERMPLEYCDDCGAPLFPNPEGELVHAQIPESAEPAPHLH